MIVKGYYFSMIMLSLICSGIYLFKWRKHFDIYYSALFMLFPMMNVGYYLLAVAKDVGEALTAIKIYYAGGCYLLLCIAMSVFSLCNIRLNRVIVFGILSWSTILYASVLTAGHLPYFYKNVRLDLSSGYSMLHKEYGPMHTAFMVTLSCYFAISILTVIYGLWKKKDAPVKSLIVLLVTLILSMIAFFFGKLISGKIEFVPAAYLIDAIAYLLVVERLALYDITGSVSESLVEHGEYGFISLDLNLNYLGANRTAKDMLPGLDDSRVDMKIQNEALSGAISSFVDDFRKDEISREQFYNNGNHVLKVQVGYLFDGNRKRGYRLSLMDDTAHQQYLTTITEYNRNLRAELSKKDRMIEKLKEKGM